MRKSIYLLTTTPTSHTHLLLTTSTSHIHTFYPLSTIVIQICTSSKKIVESGWNVWVWLVGVVSKRRVWLAGGGCGWNLWVWLVARCGCKEVYIFPHITYPYSLVFCSFLQQHPYFLFIKPRRACAARVIVVGLCVYVCVRSNLPPHTLESQKRDTNGFIARNTIQE